MSKENKNPGYRPALDPNAADPRQPFVMVPTGSEETRPTVFSMRKNGALWGWEGNDIGGARDIKGIGVVVALTGGPGDKCLSNGDSWEDSTIQTVDVLCQCGWGCLSLPEAHVPNYCPVCDYQFKPQHPGN